MSDHAFRIMVYTLVLDLITSPYGLFAFGLIVMHILIPLQSTSDDGSSEVTPPAKAADHSEQAIPTHSGGPAPQSSSEPPSKGSIQPNEQGQETPDFKSPQVTVPSPKDADSADIPSQVQIQKDKPTSGGVVPSGPSPSSPPTKTGSDGQSTRVATPPPRPRSDASEAEQTPPPVGGSGSSTQLGGVFSRLKKRVVETAWQGGGGGEAKVRNQYYRIIISNERGIHRLLTHYENASNPSLYTLHITYLSLRIK